MADYLTMAELEHRTLKEIYTYARELKIPYYSLLILIKVKMKNIYINI